MRPGDVYDLTPHPKLDVGPWRDGAHPALVLAVTDEAVTVCPMTSSPQRGLARAYSAEIVEPVDGLTVPIWAACPYLTTIDREAFASGARLRARLPVGVLRVIRTRIGGRLGIPTPP